MDSQGRRAVRTTLKPGLAPGRANPAGSTHFLEFLRVCGEREASPPSDWRVQERKLAQSDLEPLKQQQARLHHVAEHLANERTILAWIRTAIAVMTLGIGINRFSLFLQEFSRLVPGSRTVNVHAEELGIGLVVLGVVLMLGAIWHYLHVARMIDDENYRPSRFKIVGASLAVLLVGGTSLVWLLW